MKLSVSTHCGQTIQALDIIVTQDFAYVPLEFQRTYSLDRPGTTRVYLNRALCQVDGGFCGLHLCMTPTLRKALKYEIELLKLLEENAKGYKISRAGHPELRTLAIKEGETNLAAACRKPMPIGERIGQLSTFLVEQPESTPTNRC